MKATIILEHTLVFVAAEESLVTKGLIDEGNRAEGCVIEPREDNRPKSIPDKRVEEEFSAGSKAARDLEKRRRRRRRGGGGGIVIILEREPRVSGVAKRRASVCATDTRTYPL